MKKTKAILLEELYNDPATSLLMFHFGSKKIKDIEERLEQSKVSFYNVDGKDIYCIDDFFSVKEKTELTNFFEKAPFSRFSYGSEESIEKGESPAKCMNAKEKWDFFSEPPAPVKRIYDLLEYISKQSDIEISTLPWELCSKGTGSPSVIVNKLFNSSLQSKELGKHQDSDPSKNLAFAIPKLFSEGEYFAESFENGMPEHPWVVTLMLYSRAKNFSSDYRLGTVFYEKNGNEFLTVDCVDSRMVLFEGDIWHSIEESKIPKEVDTWRVSCVFKLVFNPKKQRLSPRQALKELLFF